MNMKKQSFCSLIFIVEIYHISYMVIFIYLCKLQRYLSTAIEMTDRK